MDIAATSTSMSQANLAQNVSLALTKKALDVQEQNSASTIQMIEQSAVPNLGKNLDIRV